MDDGEAAAELRNIKDIVHVVQVERLTDDEYVTPATLRSFLDSILSLNKGLKAPLLIDDLLRNVPEPRSKHSLYQNFRLVSAPQPSVSAYTLALQRESAACEVQDLDYKIARLKEHRQKAFNKMIELESDQPKAALMHFFNPGEQVHHLSAGDTPVDCLDVNSPFGSLVCSSGSKVTLHSLNLDSPVELKGTEGRHVNCVVLNGADPIILVGAGNDLFLYPQESQNPLFYAEPSQLLGHMDSVVAIHYDGLTAVSSSTDKTVRLWDPLVGKCIKTLDTFAFGVCNALQHEQVVLSTGSQDGVVRLWDLRSAKPERELVGGHTSPISALKFSGLELISGAEDGSLRTWDLRNGKIKLADAYNGTIRSLGFDDTRVIAQIQGEKMARVIDKRSGEQRMLAITDSVITSSKYLDGYYIAGRDTGDIGVWAV